MFIDTIYRKSVKHVNWSHPLRVTFCQIIIHRNHMHTITSKCIKEYRQSTYQGFTFPCCHFGDFTFMKHNTTKQLYIIMDHIPLYFCTSCLPVILIYSFISLNTHEIMIYSQLSIKLCGCNYNLFILRQTASGLFYNRKSFGKYFV